MAPKKAAKKGKKKGKKDAKKKDQDEASEPPRVTIAEPSPEEIRESRRRAQESTRVKAEEADDMLLSFAIECGSVLRETRKVKWDNVAKRDTTLTHRTVFDDPRNQSFVEVAHSGRRELARLSHLHTHSTGEEEDPSAPTFLLEDSLDIQSKRNYPRLFKPPQTRAAADEMYRPPPRRRTTGHSVSADDVDEEEDEEAKREGLILSSSSLQTLARLSFEWEEKQPNERGAWDFPSHESVESLCGRMSRVKAEHTQAIERQQREQRRLEKKNAKHWKERPPYTNPVEWYTINFVPLLYIHHFSPGCTLGD